MCVRGCAHALAPLGACSIDLNYTYFLIPLPAATAKGFPESPLLKWMNAHTSHTSLHLSQTDSWTAGQCWTWDYKQWILRRGGIRSYTLLVQFLLYFESLVFSQSVARFTYPLCYLFLTQVYCLWVTCESSLSWHLNLPAVSSLHGCVCIPVSKTFFCGFFCLLLVFRFWPAPCLSGCLILIAMFVHDLLLPIRLKILHSGLCSSASLPLFYLDSHLPAFTSTVFVFR